VAEKTTVQLAALEGGTADNVIARACQAVVCVADAEAAAAAAAAVEAEIKAELAQTDAGVRVVVEKLAEAPAQAVTAADTAKLIRALQALPQGVQAMSKSIEGLVQTSLNMGQLNLKDTAAEIRFSLRSSVTAEKAALLRQVQDVIENEGGSISTDGDYPAWEYREQSPLRDLFIQVYVDQYGKQPKVEAIHAGLECGLLSGKRPALDCISIGPDLQAVHSVDEKLSISSTKRVWELVLEVLKRSK
jgi:dipeptidase D